MIKVGEDLLHRGSSGHVIELQVNLTTLRDKANHLVAKEGKIDVDISRQADHAISMKTHEQCALATADTTPQIRPTESRVQTTGPQTPLNMLRVTRQTLWIAPIEQPKVDPE